MNERMKNPMRKAVLASLLALVPVASDAATAVDLTAGRDHACALDAGGDVSCWGDNFFGQLGTGDTSDRATPVATTGLGSGVGAVSAGYRHTCAVTAAGGIKCWGYNQFGRLGDGTTTDSSTPVDVVGLTSGATAVAAGNTLTCGLTAGGVKCWGANGSGQLGDGTNTASATPVDVSGLGSGVVAIDAGEVHACALTSAGGVKCWGSNQYGQLGDGTTTSRNTPVDAVSLTSGVVAISAGWRSTCALTSAGGVKCWGYGANVNRTVPTEVIGLASGVAHIATEIGEEFFANDSQNCAVTTAGELKCWAGSGSATVPGTIGDFESGVSRAAPGAGTWVVTTAGEIKVVSRPRQGSFGYSGYGFLTSSGWRSGCVAGFGDSDNDGLCDPYDACTSTHGAQTFPVFKTPKSKVVLSRINTETVPGNDQMILRGRFELPTGKTFADLAPGTTGARVVLVSPHGETASFAMPPGTYAGRGTAGWTLVPAGKPRWEFVDSTGAPGTKTVTRVKLTDYGPGTTGGIVDVNLVARAGSFPLGPSDVPLQVLVLLDDSVAGAGGLCGQGAFNCHCRFAVSGKTLNCNFGLRRGFVC
jgi:Regulator of chromosome condensation (RCC1) repeat